MKLGKVRVFNNLASHYDRAFSEFGVQIIDRRGYDDYIEYLLSWPTFRDVPSSIEAPYYLADIQNCCKTGEVSDITFKEVNGPSDVFSVNVKTSNGRTILTYRPVINGMV